jgi:hypothetical protein
MWFSVCRRYAPERSARPAGVALEAPGPIRSGSSRFTARIHVADPAAPDANAPVSTA